MSEGSWHMVVLQLINKSLGLLDNNDTGDEELLVENIIFNNLTG